MSMRPDLVPDDVELLARMRHGQEAALELLYLRYAGLIFTLALRILDDRELAREVLQDTLLRAWDGRETYDPQRGRVAWWLMRIARNRAVDVLRSRSHQARLRERDPSPDVAGTEPTRESADAIVLRRAVVDALGALPPGQRRAIELAYYGGLTQEEIARELGQPLGTIKSRTRDALDRLRSVLWPHIDAKGGAAP
jgi:RNA polymerase sigma-70 factor, ECF subfamily